MTCSIVQTEHGKAFICGSYKNLNELAKVPEIKCYICGNPAAVLCDAISGVNETCDRPMCREHSHNIGKDTDVCQGHYNDYEIEQAKVNRVNMAGWPIRDNIYCPDCKSEEHGANATFCKICGTKLVKETSL